MNKMISKAEICNLIEKFSNSLGFGDVATMKQTAYQFKSILHLSSSSDDNDESDFSCVSPSQDPCPRKSLCPTSVLNINEGSDDEDEERFQLKPRKPRKSRKSVCVAPRIVMSSSSEEDEEDDNGIYLKESMQSDDDDDDDEIKSQKSKHRPKRIIESSDGTESDDGRNYSNKNDNATTDRSDTEDDANESGLARESSEDKKENFDPIKKQINYIESSGDEDIQLISQSLQKQKLNGNNQKENNQYVDSNSGTESDGDGSEGSLKDFIVSDGDDDDVDDDTVHRSSGESDELYDEDQDSITELSKKNLGWSLYKSPTNVCKAISDDEDDDFCKKKLFKTPLPSSTNMGVRNILQEKNLQKFLTPHSQSKRLLSQFATPKSVPGTPAYKRDFNKNRDKIIGELFQLFNKTVFSGQLPADMQITWNKRMTKTAGFCYYSKSLGTRKCRIELSDKVIDSIDRIRDTLIHELCHAAAWMINGVQAGHGPVWKNWSKKANIAHPELPIISRCHQYAINTKYNYVCNGCGTEFGRHSKSIDATKHRCSKCGGIPELVNDKASSATPRTPNAYAQFVKNNFGSVKKANPKTPHREIMMMISEKFKESKNK